MGNILIGGQEVEVPGIHVMRWDKSDGPKVPEFKPGDGYNKRRVHPISACVWHWTGGEGEPIQMAATLRARRLGVEFAISRSGNVYQFCDPMVVDTADSGAMNYRSVGVEIVCYGFAGWVTDPARAIKVPVVPRLGKDRATYSDALHGRVVKTAHFYDAQYASALALARALSSALPIPLVVPRDDVGYLHRVLTPLELSAFRGHMGHYHITDSKRDPGTPLIEQIGELV